MIAVHDLMTPIGSQAAEDDCLAQVVATMCTNGHSCAVIMAKGKVRGLITERDLVTVLNQALSRETLENLPVSQVMVADPICVHQDASLLDALSLAREYRLRHLPVIDDDGQPVGMITHTDLVNVYVTLLEQQAELISSNRQLRAESRQDPLLEIGNRRALTSDIEQAAARARRYMRPYAVALLDLDWFKQYNDGHGHLAGDRALQQVVVAIQGSLRQGDNLYRYGGEELLILMPDTVLEGALRAAERARQCVEALGLVCGDDEEGEKHLTASVGVASAYDVPYQTLLAMADGALYQAKAGGRNRVFAAETREADRSPSVTPT